MENPFQILAEAFLDAFVELDAENYIEQTFTCNSDPSKSIMVTAQFIEGESPCEKIERLETKIEQLEQQLKLLKH